MTPPVDSTADLRVLFRSRHPLLVVEAADEERLLALVRRVATEASLPVWTWTAARGLARDGMDPQYRTADPRVALAFVGDLTAPGVFVFCDAQMLCCRPGGACAAVKDAARDAEPGQTIVLAGPGLAVPPGTEGRGPPLVAAPSVGRRTRRPRPGRGGRPGRPRPGLRRRAGGAGRVGRGPARPHPGRRPAACSSAPSCRTVASPPRTCPGCGPPRWNCWTPTACWNWCRPPPGTLDRVAGLAGLKRWLRPAGPGRRLGAGPGDGPRPAPGDPPHRGPWVRQVAGGQDARRHLGPSPPPARPGSHLPQVRRGVGAAPRSRPAHRRGHGPRRAVDRRDREGLRHRRRCRRRSVPPVSWAPSCAGCRTAPTGSSWWPPPTTSPPCPPSSCARAASTRCSSWTCRAPKPAGPSSRSN